MESIINVWGCNTESVLANIFCEQLADEVSAVPMIEVHVCDSNQEI
jgi:hypothetical protein